MEGITVAVGKFYGSLLRLYRIKDDQAYHAYLAYCTMIETTAVRFHLSERDSSFEIVMSLEKQWDGFLSQ